MTNKSEFFHYLRAYGGIKALLKSSYVWFSCLITIVIYDFVDGWKWYKSALSVLPNLLGFSLGGYAIMLALGDKEFQHAIKGCEDGENASPYLEASASLAHFVLIQAIALLAAVFSDALSLTKNFFLIPGCWIYFYAISLTIASTFTVFFLSRMYDKAPKK
ncbi:hypothetical protein [Desulfovibrio sp. X2]|uniref:hypothetical protein n=1 Tax=Desulfovibrio sp. X2 TaxID=941449 RepID=UPI0004136AFE|nr:hypothetical protein [Desulfovibrio sp. X2]